MIVYYVLTIQLGCRVPLAIHGNKAFRTLSEFVYPFFKLPTYSVSTYWLCVALR